MSPRLTSAERTSELDIPPGYEKLPLHLKPEMVNYPVFRKSIRTPYRWQISPDQPLPYTTLLKWMKRLGVLTGFLQITRPYCLRYGAGNAFNQSGYTWRLRCESSSGLASHIFERFILPSVNPIPSRSKSFATN
ncbi:MAG: hypothetical protein M1813_006900 [Trichoglossum hirsutum]|nr:MAG: hypothetical protein M1813_006900 [Trichoglossum hirsutum]